MTTEDSRKLINRALENATVKIFIADNFKGTGFFITPDGHILTADHCIGEYPPEIIVETRFDGKFIAQLDPDKTLKSCDMAVLKIALHPSDCIPLGRLSSADRGDKIVALGHTAGHRSENQEIAVYPGTISRFCTDRHFESDAIKGPGQSGGPVYHYLSQRVVGLTVKGYVPDKTEVFGIGRAVQFDDLFQKWPALESITAQVANIWDTKIGRVQAPHVQLTRDQKTKLVNALLECPTIADRESRLAVVRQLSPKIVNNLRDAPQPKLHLMNIVDACLNYQGGLTELVDTLRSIEEDSQPMQILDNVLKEIYQR